MEQFNKEKLILENSLNSTKKQEKMDNLINIQDKITHLKNQKFLKMFENKFFYKIFY